MKPTLLILPSEEILSPLVEWVTRYRTEVDAYAVLGDLFRRLNEDPVHFTHLLKFCHETVYGSSQIAKLLSEPSKVALYSALTATLARWRHALQEYSLDPNRYLFEVSKQPKGQLHVLIRERG